MTRKSESESHAQRNAAARLGGGPRQAMSNHPEYPSVQEIEESLKKARNEIAEIMRKNKNEIVEGQAEMQKLLSEVQTIDFQTVQVKSETDLFCYYFFILSQSFDQQEANEDLENLKSREHEYSNCKMLESRFAERFPLVWIPFFSWYQF